MATTPSWQAARAGMPGDLDGTNASAHINQMLGTHAIQPVYLGNVLYAAGAQTSSSSTDFAWLTPTAVTGGAGYLPSYDVDQPFTLPSGRSAVGRVQAALLPVGAGADVQVSLCSDSAGSPGAVLASTVVPKEWLTALGAPNGLASGGPLAEAAFNAACLGPIATYNWTQPAVSVNGAASYATPVTSGNYVTFLGGWDSTASVASANVATVSYLGGQTLSGPVPQPSLPQAAFYAMATATSSMVMFAGGTANTNNPSFNNVWTASWNPNTGTVGSWTAQANLPQALIQGGAASWGDTVYIIGGSTTVSASNAVNTVYFANAVNGQIQSWQAGPSLPQALQTVFTGVVGNWLIVAGGQTASGATSGTVYYAAINADGSLGAWRTGPSLPTPVVNSNPQWGTAITDGALILLGGVTPGNNVTSAVQTLSVAAEGLADAWQSQTFSSAGVAQLAAFPDGSPGEWELFVLSKSGVYHAVPVPSVPLVSIPLPATGLTGGGTYHLLFHQVGGDANNYVQLGEIACSSQQWLYANRYSGGPWTAHTSAALLVNIYDQGQTGRLLHTWEDPSSTGTAARTSTVVTDFRGRLLGACEATALPNNPLNSNPTFTSGVSPWTAVGGTIAQSSAQTHGGNAYSGLLTPNGTAASAYAQSEMLPVTAGQWYTASGWLYSTPGYSSVSLSVIWYDHAGNSLASSNRTVSLGAATWTQLTNTFQAPAGAAQAALAPAEGGTPPASAALYLSGLTLTAANPTTIASVAQVDYGQGVWPPTGVTQLN